VGRREAIFLVRVSGDSMTGAGIMPGDVIVVERGAEARHGEIVVAEVDGEWTLKRYQRDRSGVKLVAENPKYPEIRPGQNLTIGGVIRGAFRRYGR
jgi:SOS-response transcriptional repressor LexA